jgi:energy-coupling factor transporter ATP-binding protein EcfA2
MSAAIQASGLGKAYRRTWALRDCTLAIPEGHVAGLVGPNGAGKTTLLRLATGMLTPARGTITVLGQRPAAGRSCSRPPGRTWPACTQPTGSTAATAVAARTWPTTSPGPWSATPTGCCSCSAPGSSCWRAFPPGQGPAAFVACLASHGIREAITYQPASRYWRFQASETAIYLALALALTGYCFRRLSRLS